jgi:acyl-CoA thioester hydrolase
VTYARDIHIRWRDLDAFGHVNNSVYFTYLEEARSGWLRESLELAEMRWHVVVARMTIDFRRPLRLSDDTVRATCTLESMGTSSFTVREELRTLDGTLVAEAETVLVAVEGDSGEPRPLTEHERTALQGTAAP